MNLTELKQRLAEVRKESLQATQRNDYKAVARLTSEAARLNRDIEAATGFITSWPPRVDVRSPHSYR